MIRFKVWTYEGRFTWLQIAAHLGGWIPGFLLLVDALSDNLTANPIQAATQRMGGAGVILLLLSLAGTPLHTLTGYAPVLKLRRPLGLYAFFYVAAHFIFYSVVDYGLNIPLLVQEALEKPYLPLGILAGLILLALAVTSINKIMRRMGKRWKQLHRLVYLAGVLVFLHVALVIKGDIFTLQGDIWKPLAIFLTLTPLLVLRIPPVKQAVIRLRTRLGMGRKRKTIQIKPSPKDRDGASGE